MFRNGLFSRASLLLASSASTAASSSSKGGSQFPHETLEGAATELPDANKKFHVWMGDSGCEIRRVASFASRDEAEQEISSYQRKQGMKLPGEHRAYWTTEGDLLHISLPSAANRKVLPQGEQVPLPAQNHEAQFSAPTSTVK